MPGRRIFHIVVAVGLIALATTLVLGVGRSEPAVGFADYLGWRDSRTPAMAEREAHAVQRRIKACMTALGFAYREFVEPAPAIPDADLGPRAWAAKWGFGVATSVGVGDPAPPVADPNLAHIESLPPAARDAYRAALFGTTSSPGCSAEANETVYGRHDRLLAGIATELAELEDEIARDARTADADARWLACASSTAFRPSGRHAFGREAIDDIRRRLEAIMGPPPGSADIDQDALERLQAFEIDLALRGIDCDDRVRRTLETVRLEHEARFVEAHRAALDDIKARALVLDAELGLAPAATLDPVSFEP